MDNDPIERVQVEVYMPDAEGQPRGSYKVNLPRETVCHLLLDRDLELREAIANGGLIEGVVELTSEGRGVLLALDKLIPDMEVRGVEPWQPTMEQRRAAIAELAGETDGPPGPMRLRAQPSEKPDCECEHSYEQHALSVDGAPCLLPECECKHYNPVLAGGKKPPPPQDAAHVEVPRERDPVFVIAHVESIDKPMGGLPLRTVADADVVILVQEDGTGKVLKNRWGREGGSVTLVDAAPGSSFEGEAVTRTPVTNEVGQFAAELEMARRNQELSAVADDSTTDLLILIDELKLQLNQGLQDDEFILVHKAAVEIGLVAQTIAHRYPGRTA